MRALQWLFALFPGVPSFGPEPKALPHRAAGPWLYRRVGVAGGLPAADRQKAATVKAELLVTSVWVYVGSLSAASGAPLLTTTRLYEPSGTGEAA